MNTQVSNTIVALRTVLNILIVFLHMRITATTYQDLMIADYPVYYAIVTFCTLIERLAVPLFFCISGFLYFYSFSPTRYCFWKKTIRRLQHLVQPVFIWVSIYLLIYLVAQQLPYISELFSGKNKLIMDYNWKDLIDAYTGIQTEIPFAGQYWFLRNLFILCLFSPLFYFIFKYTKQVGVLIIGIIWLLQPVTQINAPLMNSIFFFLLGGYIGYARTEFYFSKKQTYTIYSISVIFLIITFFLSIYGYQVYEYFYELYILLGIGAVCLFCHWLVGKGYAGILIRLSAGSYFCFLLHQQILMFFKRGIYKVLSPHENIALIILYYIIPVINIVVFYVIYYYLRKKHTKLLSLLIGQNPEQLNIKPAL